MNISAAAGRDTNIAQGLSQTVHSAFWDCDQEFRSEGQGSSMTDQNVARWKQDVVEEIAHFNTIPLIPRHESPLSWWKSNSVRFPHLSAFIFKYLSSPSSTVTSERLFSTEGQIYEDSCNRLLPKNGEILTFLNRNLPLLEFKY